MNMMNPIIAIVKPAPKASLRECVGLKTKIIIIPDGIIKSPNTNTTILTMNPAVPFLPNVAI